MLSTRQDNSKHSSWFNCNPEKNLTNRSMFSEDHCLGNAAVAPWSGEDYYCRLKKQIKDKNQRKRQATLKAMCQRMIKSKKRQIANRINTVNLRINTIVSDESRFQWNTVLPKKLSTKFITQLNPNEKITDSAKKQKTQEAASVCTIHRRKSSLKLLHQMKKKSEQNEKRLENWKNQQQIFNKGYDKKNFLFFFETKNGKNVISRQKMVNKIRNLDRGKVQRAITCNY